MAKKHIVTILGLTACLLSGCGNKDIPVSSPSAMPKIEAEAGAEATEEQDSNYIVSNKESADVSDPVDVPEPKPEPEPTTESDFVPDPPDSANTQNAAYILDKLYEDKKDNVLISPMSLNMALGMIENGADGATKEALDKFLGTTDFNSTAKSIMDRYYGDPEDIKAAHEATESGWHEPVSAMNVSDSVWVSDKRTIVPSFKDKVEEIYKAEVSNIDTSNPEESAGKINSWCSDHTAGLIPEIITEDIIEPETSMVLVNTVYFNSSWLEEWYSKDGAFTDISGNRKDMEVIRNEVNSYYENDQATAFGMGYMNGLKFIGILPKTAGDFTASKIDVQALLDSDRSSEYDEIYGEMPRFKFETDNDILKNTLSELGLSVIFDPVKAEFPDLVEMLPSENTWVDDVIQKCTIDLDEYGTEASAATAVIMTMESMAMMPEKEPKVAEVILDRPFMFAIVDPESGQIAFMGKVVNAE